MRQDGGSVTPWEAEVLVESVETVVFRVHVRAVKIPPISPHGAPMGVYSLVLVLMGLRLAPQVMEYRGLAEGLAERAE